MASNYIHNGGNMAFFIDKLGFTGARDAADPGIPLKLYILEGPNFSSVPRREDGNNQEVELYELLSKAFGEGYILNPSFNYSTDVDNLRVLATAKNVTASLSNGLITITVPNNHKLKQINLVGTSAHLSNEGDSDDGKLKVKVVYKYKYNVPTDEQLFLDYTTLGLPSINAWDMQLVDIATDNVIDDTFKVSELSVGMTPRDIVFSKDSTIQINIGGLNVYSTWGVSIRLPY